MRMPELAWGSYRLEHLLGATGVLQVVLTGLHLLTNTNQRM